MPSHVPDYRLRVLIVDDEPDIRALLEEVCRVRNFAVLTAKDGLDAIGVLTRSPEAPDIVISDVQMPGADGFAVLDAALQKSPRTQVVLITGYGTDEGRARAQQRGAVAYLLKPASLPTITAMLDQLAKTAADARAAEHGHPSRSCRYPGASTESNQES